MHKLNNGCPPSLPPPPPCSHTATNKNGEIVCKKHNQAKCACFAFKKQIVKLSKDAAKSAKKTKQPTSNLYG